MSTVCQEQKAATFGASTQRSSTRAGFGGSRVARHGRAEEQGEEPLDPAETYLEERSLVSHKFETDMVGRCCGMTPPKVEQLASFFIQYGGVLSFFY